MKKYLIAGVILVLAVVAVLLIPNSLGSQVISEAKYRGYLEYTPNEAVTLAYSRCTGCHDIEKTLKFCSTCGPPFAITIHSMKKYIEVMNKNGSDYRQFSDSEAVAITQVWNALVGNWEHDFREKDLIKMLKGDVALTKLVRTPKEERPIEAALKGKRAPGVYNRDREIKSDFTKKSGKQ